MISGKMFHAVDRLAEISVIALAQMAERGDEFALDTALMEGKFLQRGGGVTAHVAGKSQLSALLFFIALHFREAAAVPHYRLPFPFAGGFLGGGVEKRRHFPSFVETSGKTDFQFRVGRCSGGTERLVNAERFVFAPDILGEEFRHCDPRRDLIRITALRQAQQFACFRAFAAALIGFGGGEPYFHAGIFFFEQRF